MARGKTKSAERAPVDGQRVYRIMYDALINPTNDAPLKGEVTRAQLEAATLDVDDLVARGVIEDSSYVKA